MSRFLVEHGSDIIDNQQFGDRRDGHFFMRVHFAAAVGENTTQSMRDDFAAVAAPFAMRWRLEPAGTRRRVLIMVSRYDHCLNDLLFRTRSGDLPIDVVAVVSNHRDHEALVTWHGIPFFHVPVTAATKPGPRHNSLNSSTRSTSTWSSSPATCRCSPTTCAPDCPAG